MDIAKKVAEIRFKYHANMTSVVNVLNQLKIMSDDKANEANKKHAFECIDCLRRLGFKVENF